MQVDLGAARAFLDLLDPSARFWHFQTADDDQSVKADALVHPSHVEARHLDAALRQLVPYNDGGAGVFLGVNAHGHGPRQLWNTKYARALTLDLDGSPLAPVLACTLPPSMVVESSPARFHAYWLTDRDFPLEDYSDVQRELAQRFGGDPAICNRNHILRLPGFVHRKREPWTVRVVHMANSRPYKIATALLLEAFPPLRIEVPEGADVHRGLLTAEQLGDLLAELDPYEFAAHDSWFALMCSAWYLTDGAGEDVWVNWSGLNTNFGNLRRETGRRWRSLAHRTASTVTGATMIKALNDMGHKEARESARVLQLMMAEREDQLLHGGGGDEAQMDAFLKAQPHA